MAARRRIDVVAACRRLRSAWRDRLALVAHGPDRHSRHHRVDHRRRAVAAGLLAGSASPRPRRRGGISLLAVVALGALITVLLLSSVTSESSQIEKALHGAVAKAQKWLQDAGVDAGKAQSAGSDASKSVSDAFHTLLRGIGTGISTLASLAVFA